MEFLKRAWQGLWKRGIIYGFRRFPSLNKYDSAKKPRKTKKNFVSFFFVCVTEDKAIKDGHKSTF